MSPSRRYERQVLLPEFGTDGQQRLSQARIAIVGAGGLGSSAAHYLTAAGIGFIRLIDHDRVEISNLNRQILHHDKDLNRAKVESAREKLSQLNPHVTFEVKHESLHEATARHHLEGIDLVIDCLDNFPTRYLLNDWCRKMHIPFVHGACRGWEGRVTLIVPGQTPCLRCIVPVAPPAEKFPIIGVTAGVIGAIQATEAIKWLLGRPRLLAGKWLLYDGDALVYRLIDLADIDPCPVCRGG